MATTQEKQDKDAADFAAAYSEDHKPSTQTDDEAFGIQPDEAPAVNEPEGAPAVAIDLDKGATGDEGSAAEEAGETANQEGAEQAAAEPVAAAAAPSLDVEKETQRLKSWEGRLKAQQAEIDRAKAEAAPAGEGEGTEAAAPAGGEGEGAGDEEDPDLKALSEDFGAEFVELLMKVIEKKARKCAAEVAGEHAGPTSARIDQIIAEIQNEKQRTHFEKIADAHSDFLDIANSADFKAWVAAMEPDAKAEADRVATSGTAKEIIALLNKYKAAKSTDDSDMDFQLDQAEGVRSAGGMKLPEAPAASQDFEKAWNEAP